MRWEVFDPRDGKTIHKTDNPDTAMQICRDYAERDGVDRLDYAREDGVLDDHVQDR